MTTQIKGCRLKYCLFKHQGPCACWSGIETAVLAEDAGRSRRRWDKAQDRNTSGVLLAEAASMQGPKGRMHGLMGGDLAFVVVSRKARLTVWPAAAVYLAARNGCLCVPSAQQSQDLQLDWSSLDKSGQQAAAQVRPCSQMP